MKRVQEVAKEYEDTFGFHTDGELNASHSEAFKAGVDFAQRWIPVEEELPPSEKKVLCKNTFDGENVYTVATYYAEHKMWITPMHLYNPDLDYTPEFWRPITIE